MKDNKNERRAIIETEGLTKIFEAGDNPMVAVDNITLDFYSTDFTIVYGPSGCGKSTLLNIITGLEPPTRGMVKVRGTDVFSMDENERAYFRAKKFGIVYQLPYWIKSLNVLENVSIPLLIQGETPEQAYSKAHEALIRVNLTAHEKNVPTELSGGQQQKAAVARALVTNPWIIIADEPTGNLDSKSAGEIIDLFLKLNTDFKRTIIMVTHNMEYLPYATRRVSMRDGRITEAKHMKRIEKLLKIIKPGKQEFIEPKNGTKEQ